MSSISLMEALVALEVGKKILLDIYGIEDQDYEHLEEIQDQLYAEELGYDNE